MNTYSEVRYDFYDDIAGVYCIDAWITDDENEEGMVVATFNPENGEVEYFNEYAKIDEKVADAIQSLKENHNIR